MAKSKKLNYSFLIICEGENTEPSFFKSIRDKVIEGYYQITPYEPNEIKITIRPEPKNDEEGENKSESPHKPARTNRNLKHQEEKNKPKIEPHPLNFVKEGQAELEDNTYNEVWVVFDHDNHPALKGAFEESKKVINNKTIQIAFSSISFEYYLLIHFERIYKVFEKSECREGQAKNRKLFFCGTNEHISDCHGESCIGGYARARNYWNSTKNINSTFTLIQNKLEIGFINSAWVRYQSFLENKNIKTYERNPFITVDALIKRLTGNDLIDYEWIDLKDPYNFKDISLEFRDRNLCIKNHAKNVILIPPNSLTKISIKNLDNKTFGNKVSINPNEEESYIEIESEELNDAACFIFEFDKSKRMFLINVP